MIHYLFTNANVEALSAIALVMNVPSNKVIQKCGFHFQGTIKLDDEKYSYYQLERKDWAGKL
ncbi:GNAT family N-acetyltransferase [Cohnella sp. LGH]|uniref:GNAT family N-acetyltransferase n=1 Tax=Cohnella sp. LGH TaxID=1619153 RepID=UPI001AD98A7C|nr:GNAT family protein [Cohnella sp. LGH]QTH40629.1 GNAT family N-acetyltransferase [Cohnella sp. LGH]